MSATHFGTLSSIRWISFLYPLQLFAGRTNKHVLTKWEALSGVSKEEFIITADEVISYVLNTIAPSQQEQLWEGVVKRHCSVEHKINMSIDVGLKAILLAYNESSNRLTKCRYYHK